MKEILKSAGYVVMLLAVYALSQVVFTFLGMTGAVVAGILSGSIDESVLSSAEQVTALFEDFDVKMYGMAAGLFLSTIATLLFIHLIKGYRLKLSLFASMSRKPLLYSTLTVFSAMFAMNIFVQWFNLENLMETQFDWLSHNFFGALTIALLAPLLEEVLFRGAIQGYLLRRFKPWVAITVASILFGAIHGNPVQVVYATLLGFVLGWLYYRTGSLLSVIVGHVLNNSLATVTTIFFGSDEELLSAASLSPAMETVSEVAMFAIFLALTVYFARMLNRVQPPVPSPWNDADNAVR